jgi:hypothetical protein
MIPGDETDKLDARLREEEAAITELQKSVGENKEASKEVKESLDNLEAPREKLEGEGG